jgi:RHS repeat-associated protein
MPMPNRNIQDANNYRYAYQGQEKDPETGKEAFELRLWDGRIGRWLSPDPYGQYASPYLGMGNNPISSIDPDGGENCGGAGQPPCVFDLDEVVVTGSASGNINRNYWSSEVNSQYDYGGTFAQWQQDFGFEGVNYPNALNIWNSEDGGAWQQQVNQWDKQARSEAAARQMLNWANNLFIPATIVISPTSFSSGLSSARGFSMKFTAKSIKSGDDIALGLGDDLFSFAKTKGFKTYRDFSVGLQVDKIKSAMHNPANRLHFNLDGFSRFQYLRFKPGGNVGYGNITNWELHTILKNPKILNRTTFYRGGTSTFTPNY